MLKGILRGMGVRWGTDNIFITLLYYQNCMQAFFSCFSCGEKPSTVVSSPYNQANPQPVLVTPSKIKPQQENSNKKQLTEFDDDKSRSATTITFRTSDTSPSVVEDEQSYIRKKIQQMRKLDLPERKAMESQFIKQHLSRVKSATVYLIEKEWSEQYTAYLKNITQRELRSINNSKLFDNRNTLRTDIKEKEDYFIINDRVWKFVQQMYGGGPSIVQDVYFPTVQITFKKHQVPITGIVNPLNLCYMIAILQCLISNHHFSHFFYKKLFDEGKKKNVLHNAIHKLIKVMTDVKPEKVEIKEIASLIESRFNSFEQHDAHEFFLYIMDILQQEAKGETATGFPPKDTKTAEASYSAYFRTNKSVVDKLFIGQIQTSLTCSRCEEQSITYNTILDIQLQIVDILLERCMNKHFAAEKIEDYDCQKCKKKTKALKQYFLTKTPNYLVLVLKKFNQTGKKIEERVKYPFQLDLRKIAKGHCGDTKYILQSVLVHKGVKSTKGHYYCYTHRHKRQNSDQRQLWQYANDQICKQLEAQEVLGRDAYILFYERK